MSTLYERFASTPDGPRHLAVARLKQEILRSLNVALRSSGVTQNELAARLKVRKSAVSQALHGDGNLRVKTVAEYLSALGYELDVRLVEAGEPRNALLEERDVRPAFPSTTQPPGDASADTPLPPPIFAMTLGEFLIDGSLHADESRQSIHFEANITHSGPTGTPWPTIPPVERFTPIREVVK